MSAPLLTPEERGRLEEAGDRLKNVASCLTYEPTSYEQLEGILLTVVQQLQTTLDVLLARDP